MPKNKKPFVKVEIPGVVFATEELEQKYNNLMDKLAKEIQDEIIKTMAVPKKYLTTRR